jgi:hypothetical protein
LTSTATGRIADAADRAADRIGNGRFGFRSADVQLGLVVRPVFHLADDLAHHLHGFQRVFARGGFRRQHHRVRTFGHGVGHVCDFGAGRGRRETHRFEHLRGHHHRFTELAAGADDVFWICGTLSAGTSTPRSPRATMIASLSSAISRSW